MAAAKDPSIEEEAQPVTTKASNGKKVEESSTFSTAAVTTPSQTTTGAEVETNNGKSATNMKAPSKSMAERKRVPLSFYMTVVSILGLQICSGFLSLSTAESVYQSISSAVRQIKQLLDYTNSLTQSMALPSEERPPVSEYLVAAFTSTCLVSVLYVLFIAPFMGGFWTGARSTRHVMHRYMGLLYLVQYGLAWTEFARDYEQSKASILPACVALNGIIQAWSAFFSFKVLPELNDAGYYSDKAVLSRNFVHENAFFTLMSVFGSMYYNTALRHTLRTTLPGRILECLYIFWPYVLVRPLFPITRFSDTGTTHKGRSAQNKRFYEIGTYMVKIFFLYAKYFLGFYANFLIFLELPTEDDWKLLRGTLLLNIGTVSIAMFLHTLRFKKILPPRLTFGIYLLQIYATIVGIPYAKHVFTSHPKLLALCFSGLLCNMTRSRKVHAVWCFVTMCLLNYKEIEW
mmetsp:Transcript_8772/g.11645  ORF Transcript_8772/g.11645 Transcript_8772/m.11645 type:complete len:459 (+) Transcript_8772:257-1633(+)|eukprot:CAMPEP_0198145682 /NCGR_PEP_ID=MMETSP1443-20131203/24840_1 /TAXON_ID=186043 /ORGANISM="Entomoneis sp., Strain CCMP2396" /LENGTH=458 /DNA_ID=CAMNT_0043809383 /DNA_START=213 /DNA_END=1586 /DNA_ORIENTATION=+